MTALLRAQDALEERAQAQPEASTSAARSDNAGATRARRGAAAAAAVRRGAVELPASEPVLQCAGYGASGGIQVHPALLWLLLLERAPGEMLRLQR